ncbi:uncharacterized protein LOC112686650 [Sipha flava]|uniref:Uncharacterized protein LOC112686650 n=1 Tax=Sipha flava TaxID=143950 RepID=A0A2S2Q254_9HEMI|nr:uncharacterized protein LOC112686650 [Sipha flava]
MEESLLSFVMRNVPDEWEDVPVYNKSYELFTVPPGLYSREYQKVEQFFHGIKIGRIQRVQNPFQYGRYMLRREMVRTNYEEIVFHGVHRDDIDTALKFNCDYRRYTRTRVVAHSDGQHPLFYNSVSDLLNNAGYHISDLRVLVLRILTRKPKTQCDYYIEYLVRF